MRRSNPVKRIATLLIMMNFKIIKKKIKNRKKNLKKSSTTIILGKKVIFR